VRRILFVGCYGWLTGLPVTIGFVPVRFIRYHFR